VGTANLNLLVARNDTPQAHIIRIAAQRRRGYRYYSSKPSTSGEASVIGDLMKKTHAWASPHYRKRSNVESAFSMMKRKFGDSLRSKTDVAMVNETLCKILCHNLVVLIHEMCELGIDPVFWPSGTVV